MEPAAIDPKTASCKSGSRSGVVCTGRRVIGYRSSNALGVGWSNGGHRPHRQRHRNGGGVPGAAYVRVRGTGVVVDVRTPDQAPPRSTASTRVGSPRRVTPRVRARARDGEEVGVWDETTETRPHRHPHAEGGWVAPPRVRARARERKWWAFGGPGGCLLRACVGEEVRPAGFRWFPGEGSIGHAGHGV